MSANPLEPDPKREHRIRERAYHLWDSEGRPHDRHDEFWERARELVGMEESAGSGQLPNPEAAGKEPSLSEPVEEASLQENLGEFPDHLTDESEGRSTPMARQPGRLAEKPVRPKSTRTAPETLPGKPSLKAKALEQHNGAASEAPKARKTKQ